MTATAASSGLLACSLCGMLNARPQHRGRLCCVRCGSVLRERKPDSLQRCAAFLIAAYVLYLPANLLPVLETGKIGGERKWDTIPSGVLQLFHDGAWPLALVILVASLCVPAVKLLSLTYLVLSVRLASGAYRRGRTQLYRVLDFIGRWSLVDIYVGGLLVGLVRFEPLASISPGPGAIAFGAVVVLTMFASHSFDPRLLWDTLGQDAHG